MNPNITRTHSKKHSSYQFYSDDTSPNHNHTLGNLLQAECSSWGHDRFFINLWNGGPLKPHAAYWIPICIAHFKESYEVKRNEVPMEGQCPGAVDMQSKVIQEKNDKSLHTGRPWFTECLFRICLPQFFLDHFIKSFYSLIAKWSCSIDSQLMLFTWIPGKGVTSEPVARRMFLVLMTCSVPSPSWAVTWFLPVTLPNPLTCVTCQT